jgi:hypothetical protein
VIDAEPMTRVRLRVYLYEHQTAVSDPVGTSTADARIVVGVRESYGRVVSFSVEA